MNLVIVDNHPIVRQGIISILTNEENTYNVREASNIKEAMDVISEEEIDIAIIDLKLGHEDGLIIASRAKYMKLNTKFIIFTEVITEEDFNRSEGLGVYGYILQEAFGEDILYAINIINRGKKYYYPEILKYDENFNKKSILHRLTSREKDVLNEVRKGLSNEEIGIKLCISQHTVKKHISSIFSKLNLSSRAQIAFKLNNGMEET